MASREEGRDPCLPIRYSPFANHFLPSPFAIRYSPFAIAHSSAGGDSMPTYKLMTYETGEGPRAGMISGDAAFDVAGATGEPRYDTVLGILNDWPRAKDVLGAFAAGAGPSRAGALDLDHVRLLAPIPRPGAIYCAGANYRDHVLEMARAQNIQPEPHPHTLGLKASHVMTATHSVVTR